VLALQSACGYDSGVARPKSNVPTPGEIEILQVFWQHGACTGPEVHQQLVKKRPVALTTVMSMTQIVHEKGWLKLLERKRPFRYEATLSMDGAKDMLLNDIKTRLFGGSAKKMAMHLVAGKKLSKQRAEKIEKLLDAVA
jgi:BlaI family transcriptional regulator, penicillinase repressor